MGVHRHAYALKMYTYIYACTHAYKHSYIHAYNVSLYEYTQAHADKHRDSKLKQASAHIDWQKVQTQHNRA